MEIKEILQKPYTEQERVDFIIKYNHKLGLLINETETELQALGLDEEEQLQQYKQYKIYENDKNRDEKLNGGVIYNNVLFDSDTDQKINLLATYSTMTDDSTIVWYGKDNNGLLCTKNDLLSIGNLITELHSYCWENNAYIKEQIENAQTEDELNEIVINYEMDSKNTDLT